MTHKRGARPHQDPLLKQLLKVDTPVVTIVGKSWKLHTQKVLRVGLEENLKMIEGSVGFPDAQGPRGLLRRRAFLRRLHG